MKSHYVHNSFSRLVMMTLPEDMLLELQSKCPRQSNLLSGHVKCLAHHLTRQLTVVITTGPVLWLGLRHLYKQTLYVPSHLTCCFRADWLSVCLICQSVCPYTDLSVNFNLHKLHRSCLWYIYCIKHFQMAVALTTLWPWPWDLNDPAVDMVFNKRILF